MVTELQERPPMDTPGSMERAGRMAFSEKRIIPPRPVSTEKIMPADREYLVRLSVQMDRVCLEGTMVPVQRRADGACSAIVQPGWREYLEAARTTESSVKQAARPTREFSGGVTVTEPE